MKYTVMECHTGYAVLMDEEARFVKAANLHYAVGQTVTEPVLMQDEPRITRSRNIGLKIAAAAACLVMAAGVGLRIYLNRRSAENEGESVVMMIEETQYEMQLNRSGEVIRVQSPDEAGQAVLAKYTGKMQKAADAANTLLMLQKSEAAMEDGETVEIYIETENEEIYESCKSDIEKGAAQMNLNAAVQERVEPGKLHGHPENHKPQTKPAKQTEPPANETEATAETTKPAVQTDERTEPPKSVGQEHTLPESPVHSEPVPALTAPVPQQSVPSVLHTAPNSPQGTQKAPELTKPAHTKPGKPERGTTPTLPQMPWAHTPPHKGFENGITSPDEPKKAESPAEVERSEEPKEKPVQPEAEAHGKYQKPLAQQSPAKDIQPAPEKAKASAKPDAPVLPEVSQHGATENEDAVPHERRNAPDASVKAEEQYRSRPDDRQAPETPAEQDTELFSDVEMQSV